MSKLYFHYKNSNNNHSNYNKFSKYEKIENYQKNSNDNDYNDTKKSNKKNKINIQQKLISIRKQSQNSSDSTTEENEEIKNQTQPQNIIQKQEKKPFKSTSNDFKVKYKTELCKFYTLTGYCKFGENCAYAHGIENLRSKVTNSIFFRSKKCVSFFEKGFCPYGNRCQFQHQIKSNIINNPYEKNMSYENYLKTMNKFENIMNIKALRSKKRLQILENLVKSEEDIKESKLFEDIKKMIKKKEDIYEKIEV